MPEVDDVNVAGYRQWKSALLDVEEAEASRGAVVAEEPVEPVAEVDETLGQVALGDEVGDDQKEQDCDRDRRQPATLSLDAADVRGSPITPNTASTTPGTWTAT